MSKIQLRMIVFHEIFPGAAVPSHSALPLRASSFPSSPLRLALGMAFLMAATPVLAQRAPAAATDDAPTPAVSRLDAITVEGEASARTATEATRAYTAPSTASTGLDMTARETPQSVSVITRQQLDDQNIETLDQALSATAGVTRSELDVGARTTFRARGFDISNYKVDGLAIDGTSDFSGTGAATNLDLYDRVEIVRGANGLLGGTGDPSATINLVRKRPGRELAGSAGISTGSWNRRRLDADLTVPFTQDGSVRSRLVVVDDDSDTFRHRQDIRQRGVLLNTEADLGTNTTVGLGVQWERNRTNGASWGANVPIWFADGTATAFSRRLNTAADWSYTQRDTRTLFGSLSHRFAGGWRADLSLAGARSEAINNFGVIKANSESGRWGGLWNQDGSGAALNGMHAESESRNRAGSLTVSGPFTLLGREHELVAGLNGDRAESTSYTFSYSGGNCNIDGVRTFQNGRSCQYRLGLPVADWRDWDGSFPGYETYRTDARSVTHTTNTGGYLAGRFSLAEPLTLIAGVRRSRYETRVDTYTAENAYSRGESQRQNVWTPYAGLVADLSREYSAYASYTDVFKPQTQKDVSGSFIEPVRGASYEGGLKAEWLEGRLNGSFALFRAKQENVALSDGSNTTPDGAQAYVARGTGIVSRGVDVELAGALTPNWNVYLGYTNLSVDDANTAERPDPKHLIRLTSTYRFTEGALSRLTIGGGMSVQSYTVGAPYPGRPLGNGQFDGSPVRLPGYALVHLMARYDFSPNLSATLNVSNLFDKTYYRQYGFYNGLIYGEPRRITVGLTARY